MRTRQRPTPDARTPAAPLADAVLLAAASASLIAVGIVLAGVGHASGIAKYLLAGLALISVFLSWALIHTVFTLRYARLYYSGHAGGIDFNDSGDPDYRDFAYLAFTIGHDVPGLRHQHPVQANTADRTAARLARVSPGRRDHRHDDQPRGRTGQMTATGQRPCARQLRRHCQDRQRSVSPCSLRKSMN